MQPQVLLAINLIAATQSNLEKLPERAFKHLIKRQGLARDLATLAESGARLEVLLSKAAGDLVEAALHHDHHRTTLLDIVRLAPLGAAAERLTSEAISRGTKEGGPAEAARSLVQALERRFPEATDRAINAQLAAAEKEDRSAPTEPKKNAKTAAASASRERLFGFLEKAFAGTVRAPLEGSDSTLLAAVDAPASGLRLMALKRLDEVYRAAPEDAEGLRSSVLSAALRRIEDEDPQVAAAALGMAALSDAVPAALLGPVMDCLARQGLVLEAKASSTSEGRKAAVEGARAAAKRSIRLLGDRVVPQLPAQALAVGAALLGFSLAPTGASIRKVLGTAVSELAKLAPLAFAGVADAVESAEADALKREEEAPSAKKGKKGRKSEAGESDLEGSAKDSKKKRLRRADEAVSAAVVSAVAKNLAESTEAAEQMAALAAQATPRGRHAALLFLTSALQQPKAKSRQSLALAVLTVLRTTGLAILACPEGIHAAAVEEAAKEIGTPAHFKSLVGSLDLALACVARAALSAALPVAAKEDALATELLVGLAPLAVKDDTVQQLAEMATSASITAAPALLAGFAADFGQDQAVASVALRYVWVYVGLTCLWER